MQDNIAQMMQHLHLRTSIELVTKKQCNKGKY